MEVIRTVEHKEAVYAALDAARGAGDALPPPVKALVRRLGIKKSSAAHWRHRYIEENPGAFPAHRPYRSRSIPAGQRE